MCSWDRGWRPYVPVARRRAQARQLASQLARSGRKLEPVEVQGRSIASTFWGQSWCQNLEGYSDFANRLPRGRTYVRNGSVIDLQIQAGRIEALVSGSEVYEVEIQLKTLSASLWRAICRDCAGSIDSLLDLLGGRFDKAVMQRLTRQNGGLFPKPQEIGLNCSCPDWATMCKHVAAVLYGVGARLDQRPELLFLLRNVDHTQMLTQAGGNVLVEALESGASGELEGEDLSSLFGIDLDTAGGDEEDEATAKASSGSKGRGGRGASQSRKSRSMAKASAPSLPRTGEKKATARTKAAKGTEKNSDRSHPKTGTKVNTKSTTKTKTVRKQVAKSEAVPSRKKKAKTVGSRTAGGRVASAKATPGTATKTKRAVKKSAARTPARTKASRKSRVS